MKKSLLLLVLFAAFGLYATTTSAQGNIKSGPEASTLRDPELEKDSLHNLEVARQYFKLKHAYVAALKRCEEVMAGNPNFAKMDEILFMAGESSLSLAENKGKQKASLYVITEGNAKRPLTADEFRVLGRGYLAQLIADHPQSEFRKHAEDDLQAMGGPMPKAEAAKP
jgi:hypothetical protein